MTPADASQCPSIESLRELLEETLTARSYKSISKHLETCVRCQDRLETLSDDPLMTRTATTDPFGPTIPDSVHAGLDKAIDALKSYPISGSEQDAESTVDRNHHNQSNQVQSDQVQSDHRNWDSLRFPDPPSIDGATGAIGQYEVMRRIASGASSVLYRAWDTQQDRPVALKVLRDHFTRDSESYQRMTREANAASKLQHENILPVYELIARQDFPPLLVMELLSGKTLADLTAHRESVSPRRATQLVLQAANGLAAAHTAGLIHRDIKPSNLLVDNRSGDERVLVADFGLVRDQEADSDLTRTGDLAGTPAYMSPEQVDNAKLVDARSDVYSLGCVLYQLLTGQPPFSGTVRMVLWQIMQEDPKPPRVLDDRVPVEIENVCLKAISKAPAQRYESAGEFARDLQRFVDGLPTLAKPVSRFAWLAQLAKRHPIITVSTIAVFLSSISIAAITSISSFRLAEARNRVRLEAARAAEDRDIALDAVEAMVFDVYDDLDKDEFDVDEVQIAVLQRAAEGLARIKAGGNESVLRHQAETHSRLGQALWRLDRNESAAEQLKESLDRIQSMDNTQKSTRDIRLLELRTSGALARVRYDQDLIDQMRPLIETASDLADVMLGDFPTDDDVIRESASVYQDYAYMIADQQDDEEAAPTLEKSLSVHQQLGDIATLDYTQQMIRVRLMIDVADSLYNRDQPIRSLAAYGAAKKETNLASAADTSRDFYDPQLWIDYLFEACCGEVSCLVVLEKSTDALQIAEQAWRIVQLDLDARIDDWHFFELADLLAEESLELAQEDEQTEAIKVWTERQVQLAKLQVESDSDDVQLQAKKTDAERRLQRLTAGSISE